MQSWLASVQDMPLQVILEAPANPTGCYAQTDTDGVMHVVISAIPLPHAELGPPVVAPSPTPIPAPPPPQPTPTPAPSAMQSWIVTLGDTPTEVRVDAPMNPAGCWIIWNLSRHVAISARLLTANIGGYPTATLGPPASE